MIYLSEFCDLMNGYAFKSKDYVDNSNTLNCRMSNIRPDGKFDILYNAKYLPDSYAEDYSKYLLKDRDIVIAMTDMASDPKILGVPTIVNTMGKKLLLNQRVGKLIIKDASRIDISYLRYALSRNSLKAYFKKFAGGGLQINIGKKEILGAQIPLPPLEIQKKIVEVLDKAQELIDLRKKQIELLDELIQSVFYDMFGDPYYNPNGWNKSSVKDISDSKAMNGFFAKNDEYTQDGAVGVIWLGDFINKFYSDTVGLRRINPSEKDFNKYRVEYGDILFCRSSLNVEGIGKASCVPNSEEPLMFECHIIKTTLDRNKMIPEFFKVLSNTKYFRNQVMQNSKTATMTTISQDGIIKCDVIVPPINIQEEFLQKLEKIFQQKILMQQSLLEMENNFNSLMQRAFKGELFN